MTKLTGKPDQAPQLQWNVNLDVFEGPLDLLLHLINELEIDIYDILISDITAQYLAYINQAHQIELNISGEYLVMAATLMAIKSQLLLPRNDQVVSFDEDYLENEDDPRSHLMQLLIEYRTFKVVSDELRKCEAERLESIGRPAMDLSDYQEHIPLQDGDVSLEEIRQAFIRVLDNRAMREPIPTKIKSANISVADKMKTITEQLRQVQTSVTFQELLESTHKSELIASFLAILELIKAHTIQVNQSETYGDIVLTYVK